MEEALQFRRDRIGLGDNVHDAAVNRELVDRVKDMSEVYGNLLNGTAEGVYLNALKREYNL